MAKEIQEWIFQKIFVEAPNCSDMPFMLVVSIEENFD